MKIRLPNIRVATGLYSHWDSFVRVNKDVLKWIKDSKKTKPKKTKLNSIGEVVYTLNNAVKKGGKEFLISEKVYNELKSIFTKWIQESNNLEKRAILVSLAHPKFLDENKVKFCFEITDVVLKQMDKKNEFDILRKGLAFTISVFAAANPELGFSFIKKWIGKDKIIDNIMKENLMKNRLVRKYPEEVKNLLNLL